ncbi:alpha/beta hydrolase [Rhodobacteraceae bacterium N5(2021)]|uniref:Alpha/beta hydrolase n=1 Tax=Gymnodinialimonas phycosphaerae TaxID=2841589 RepID=A0A975TXB6_9RHOB|nr:alpha/beta hydrolase [Gymnodinialimonas phycosphaerae]MBY4892222.1 alpha/beta hydrolase [Gymnodinialimonas phycosphaerae]
MKILLWLLALLVVFAVLTVWRATRNEAAAEAAFPPAGDFVDVGGTRVHYVEEGEGPVVVYLHGSGGNLNDGSFDLVARLSDRYRVIAFDRPGLGYTDMLGHNTPLAAQARLLADAALALGAENPIVVGHSFGGAVAMAWGIERPDVLSGLVILAGATNPWDTGISTYYKFLSHPLAGPVMANLLAAWVPERIVTDSVNAVFAPQSAPPGYYAHFGPGLTLRRFSLLENARQRASLLPQIEAMVPRYPSISVPTEILHGDADATVGLHIHSVPLSQQIPDATLTVLEGVGHMPHHADPQAVVDAIDRLAGRAGLR